MTKLIIAKYLVTALLVVAVSEIAKRSDRFGALLASLPFVTTMVMVWLHLDNPVIELARCGCDHRSAL